MKIAILTFLDWNISLNHDLITELIFCDFFGINKRPFELEFSLNHDLITKPIFRDIFSINESLFETEFNLSRDLITELVFCDSFSDTGKYNFLAWDKVYHDLIY